jgi:hypothetical protein
MNTTQRTQITASTSDSDGNGEAVPRRCYEELVKRFQQLSEQCAQLSKRMNGLERSASTQNELQRQILELLATCLAVSKNVPTQAEFGIVCNRLNELSGLVLPIADALGAPSKDSG